MKGIRTWLRRMADYSRASIRRQVLFLVLACGIGTFAATLMLFGYYMHGLQEYLPKAKNPVLGVREGMAFVAESLTLQPGDSLFLYTDGVTEAMDAERGFFGEQRLQDTLSAKPGQGAGEQLETVLEAVSSFVGEASQSDDITMLALAYGNKDEI